MENLTIKTLKTVAIEDDFTLSTYFTICKYTSYKLLDDKTCLAVTYYPNSLKNIFALELFPNIRVENIRYVQYLVKLDNFEVITEQEFVTTLNECKKFISAL